MLTSLYQMDKKQIGSFYEKLAVDYLKQKKYKIITRNYKTKFGEIDIIAYDKTDNCFVFVEVRYRKSSEFGLAQQTVDFYKQKKITMSAVVYVKTNQLKNVNLRFDIIAINYNNEIEHIKNAFQINFPKYVHY